MSKNTGGSAFPTSGPREDSGMTLRDYFAAKAMQAICSRPVPPKSGDTHSHIADLAYATADAMLAARGVA